MAADGNFDPMTADPNIGAGIGNVANDPEAEAPIEEPGAEGIDSGEEGGIGDDSTASIIDQLSDEDKEAVRNYAESLLSRNEVAPQGDMGGMEEPAAPAQDQGQGVMMEITKGRLKNVQKALQEKFRDVNKNEKDERKAEKVNKDFKKTTPFDSPVK